MTLDQPQQSPSEYFFLDHLQSVKGAEWYYNQRFLGRGGNGTAFLVTCSSGSHYGMQFVLKVFHRISDPVRRRAFLDEIGHLRSINHPAITRIFDEGTFRTPTGTEHPFAVIEYVPVTARQLIVSRQIDRLHAIRIAFNCLSALNSLHTAAPQLIHRDLKPENILISDIGAKLADFGLVKVLDDLNLESQTDPFDGTQWPGMPWRYRTPELVARALDHETAITTASDIFQFGTVLYELLTGFNPQRPVNRIADPIELDLRELRGDQGHQLGQLTRWMLSWVPTDRPSAMQCLNRMNVIQKEYCDSLFRVTGQHV